MKTIRILSHADYSGQIRRSENASGLSFFKHAIDRYRNEDPEHTLLLDAGDNFKHVLWDDFVRKEVLLLGTDVFELGNHEFDNGKAELEFRISEISDKVEVLCANIVNKSDGSFIKGVKPYTLLQKGGITYGILGLCTEYTPYMVTSSMIEPFKVLDSVKCAREYIPKMREEGAEIIVVLTHFPFYENRTGELFDVFNEIKDLKPDVMIGGHIPGDFAQVIDGCIITKAGFGGKSLGVATIEFDEETRQILSKKAEVYDVYHEEKEVDKETAETLRDVLEPYAYYFDEVLCEIKKDIPMRLDFESEMGDLLSDAVREYFKTDFAYFNCTSCGKRIPKGPLTREGIAEAMGFNDELYISVYRGQDLYDLFEHVHEPERFGNNGNLMFSGICVKMDHTKPSGQKIVYITDLEGYKIQRNAVLTVVTSEYMASGGNDTKKISGRVEWRNTHTRIHDVLADYFKKKQVIEGVELGRYPFIGKPENDNSPW